MIIKSLFYQCGKVFIFMNIWTIGKKFNQTSLPSKECFHSHLNMEDITDADYGHTIRVCEYFEIKYLVEHHDLYVQCDTLLSANLFGNFRNICIEIYEPDPAKKFSVPGLA